MMTDETGATVIVVSTLKYMLAIAAGIPTIHYNWLIHCCQQRCLLPYNLYALPAGYSVEKDCNVFMCVRPTYLAVLVCLMDALT